MSDRRLYDSKQGEYGERISSNRWQARREEPRRKLSGGGLKSIARNVLATLGIGTAVVGPIALGGVIEQSFEHHPKGDVAHMGTTLTVEFTEEKHSVLPQSFQG